MASRRTRHAQSETRQRRDGRWQHVYGALDLGTNNCRLLVAKPNVDGFHVIDAFSRIVRLGEGLGNSSILTEQAMDRTIEALHVCRSKVERNGVTRLRAVATEACRRAENGAAFIERVRAEANIDLEVIAAAEEAELALIGCSPLYDVPQGDKAYALLFDIGGGSTQITWLKLHHVAGTADQVDTEIIDCISVPCGVVTLSERFGCGEDKDGRASPELCDASERQHAPRPHCVETGGTRARTSCRARLHAPLTAELEGTAAKSASTLVIATNRHLTRNASCVRRRKRRARPPSWRERWAPRRHRANSSHASTRK